LPPSASLAVIRGAARGTIPYRENYKLSIRHFALLLSALNKKHPLIALVGQLPEKEQKKFQKKLWNVLFFSIFCVPLRLG